MTQTTVSRRPRESLRALIVDDDDFQLGLLTETLRACGVRSCSTADSGEKALRLLNSGFDLLLVDLYMPGMDGFQFMQALAQRGFSGGLILVSGQTEEVLRSAELVARLQRFQLLGAVTKPVGRDRLGQLIDLLQ